LSNRVLGVLHQRHLSRSTHHLKKSMSQRCCWEWEKCIPPPPGPVAELKLNNSFTRKKDLFKPLQDNTIHWYSCGPTVYDKSHMGHARSYVSFDIIRKILKGYFGYNVFLQMNITDIDDKIIRRARQNHLFDNWKKASPQKDDIVDLATKGIERFQSKHDKEEDADKKKMYADHLTKARAALGAFESPEAVFDACVDSMSDHLDAEKGSTVTDNSIFETLPRYWEGKYFEDMAALNIEEPDCLTRVSEYVPEIVAFVEKIIENGYAYESNGSVYFAVADYDAKKNHYYAKLVPEAVGNKDAIAAGIAEGEGALAENTTSEKRSDSDFALWKASKPGEPAWESPWGMGRPGWHIECSAMASDVMGKTMDIHSGGVDLKFPHHDNEIAQSEAFYDSDDWVRYFLHTGHLTIAGCKMSKSLKNFISIQEALEKNTSRQIRLAFLLHAWDKTLDYSDNTMRDAVQYEKNMNEFFMSIKAAIMASDSALLKWTSDEKSLHAEFEERQRAVHERLCDNIDTAGACLELRNIVSAVNKYLAKAEQPNARLLKVIGEFVTKMLKCFGCIEGDSSLGFPKDDQSGGGGVDRDTLVAPYLQVTASFRADIRQTLKSAGKDELVAAIMELCDDLRDQKLVDLGVRLEDKMDESGKPVIKLADRDTLIKEREEKAAAKAAAEAKKAAAKAKKESEEAEKERVAKIQPTTWFTIGEYEGKFLTFNERGLPLTRPNAETNEPEEIPKAQSKKLDKELKGQEKRHSTWLKKQSK